MRHMQTAQRCILRCYSGALPGECPSDFNTNKVAPAHCMLKIYMQVYMHCVSQVAAEVCKPCSVVTSLACLQVTHKHDRSQSGNDDLVPASYPQRSPCKSALRQRPAAQCRADSPGQQRADVQTTQWHAAIDSCSSLRPQRLHQHSSSMDTLCRDMQQLDAQIADLDLNLVSASRRLHC